MAKARQTVTTKVRRKKVGNGYKKCSNCGGDGIVRIRKKK